MDPILQSVKISPLTRALTKGNATLDKFIYSMGKSSIPLSKNKYRLQFPDTTDYNRKLRFKLHRIGIVDSLILKVQIDIANQDTNSAGQVVPSKGGALNLFKSFAITDGKQSLCKIDKEYILYWLSKQPYKKQKVYAEGYKLAGVFPELWNAVGGNQDEHARSLRGLNTNSSQVGTCCAHIYIPFPSCDSIGSYLDLSLLDQLYLEVETGAPTDMERDNSGIGSGYSHYSINQPESYLQVHYLNMDGEHYKSYQEKQYKDNLNFVLQDQWILDDKNAIIPYNNIVSQKVQIDIPCNKLIKQILIRVMSGNEIHDGLRADGCAGIFNIKSLQIHMNGSLWQDWDGYELMLRRAKDEEFAPFIDKYQKDPARRSLHDFGNLATVDGTANVKIANSNAVSVNDLLDWQQGRRNNLDYIDLRSHVSGSETIGVGSGVKFTEHGIGGQTRPETLLEDTFYVLDFTMPKFSKDYNCPFGGGVLFSATSQPYIEVELVNHRPKRSADTLGESKYIIKTSCIHYNVWSVNKNSGQILVANNR